jgi:hypothetical protein
MDISNICNSDQLCIILQDIPLTILFGEDNAELQNKDLLPANVTAARVKMPHAFGTHHTKVNGQSKRAKFYGEESSRDPDSNLSIDKKYFLILFVSHLNSIL